MGKSKKQTTVEVAASVDVVRAAGKKGGKRGVDEAVVSKSAKKQKVVEKELVTKKNKDDSSDVFDSEDEKVTKPSKKKINKPLKQNKKEVKKQESSSDESSDSDEELTKVVKKQAAKPAPANKKVAKKGSSSDDTSPDSDQDLKTAKKAPTVKDKASIGVVKNGTKKQENGVVSSDSDDSSSESEDEKLSKKPKKPSAAAASKAKAQPAKEDSSDDSSEDDSSDDSDVQQTKPASTKPKAAQVKGGSISDESSPDEESDEEPAKASKPAAKAVPKESSSSDEESDEEPAEAAKAPANYPTINGSAKKMEENDKDEDGDTVMKTPSANKQQSTPAPPSTGGSKTVFVKNLAWAVDEDSVKAFFKSAGDVKEVRLARSSDGEFRGFGHVEFYTEDAAKKACMKTGETLSGRDIFVDLAKERAPFSPGGEGQGRRDFGTPRSAGGNQRFGSDSTAFVRGFDKFQDEDSIRNSLMEFFGDCAVQKIRIPTDRETGNIKGFAYVDFKEKQGLSKAIEYNGSDLNGRSLFVEEAGGPPTPGSAGGRGGRGGGERGRGGRGGRGGGRGGRGGFGGPKKELTGTGRKTTFGDD